MRTLQALFTSLTLALYISSVESAPLYKWTDSRGNTHYSDAPPPGENATVKALSLQPLNMIQPPNVQATTKMKEAPPLVSASVPVKTPKEEALTSSLSTCFSPSPIATGMSITKRILSKEEHNELALIFTNMKGKWRGTVDMIECSGDTASPELITTSYSTDLNIKLRRSRELSLSFDMYSSELGISKEEKMNFYLSEQYLSLSLALSDLSVMTDISEKGYSIWVDQTLGTGVARELLRTITLTNRTLAIDQYTFANGTLVLSARWTLKQH